MVCEPEVFNYISELESCIFEEEPMNNIANAKKMAAYKHNGFWRPMDTLKDKLDLNNLPEITTIDNCYGSERDDIYRKTKIYINIHCSNDHNTMELIRVVNLLSKNVIVISYNTVNTPLLYFSKNILIANSIEELKKIILEVYNNYKFYYNFYSQKFDENDYKKYIKNNLDNLIKDYD